MTSSMGPHTTPDSAPAVTPAPIFSAFESSRTASPARVRGARVAARGAYPNPRPHPSPDKSQERSGTSIADRARAT
eukprot:scaffold88791_cov65-Phaeocystis_antarctica.AAC.8